MKSIYMYKYEKYIHVQTYHFRLCQNISYCINNYNCTKRVHDLHR